SSVCEEGDECKLYDRPAELCQDLLEYTFEPEIMIFDVCFFNECIDFFFGYENTSGNHVPIVFFNDPFVQPSHRAAHWLSRMESRCDYQKFHCYIPFLEKLNAYVEKKGLVNLFDNAFPPILDKSKNDESYKVRMRKIMSPSVFNVFRFFVNNKNREISIDEIIECMGINKAFGRNTVYAYISRLRNLFQGSLGGKYEILRTGKGLYRIIIN
ncbi:MAG: helix-turn-helix domain-containing protein, partial [Treponemataceae bacterium]|nr:helix-turn-helix domain-containing protein [Treponemataceae bacterium]